MVLFVDISLDIFSVNSITSQRNLKKKLRLSQIPLIFLKNESTLLDLFFFIKVKGKVTIDLPTLLENWLKQSIHQLLLANKENDKGNLINGLFPLLLSKDSLQFKKAKQYLESLDLTALKIAYSRKKFLGRHADQFIFCLLQPVNFFSFRSEKENYQNSGKEKANELWEATFCARSIWPGI